MPERQVHMDQRCDPSSHSWQPAKHVADPSSWHSAFTSRRDSNRAKAHLGVVRRRIVVVEVSPLVDRDPNVSLTEYEAGIQRLIVRRGEQLRRCHRLSARSTEALNGVLDSISGYGRSGRSHFLSLSVAAMSVLAWQAFAQTSRSWHEFRAYEHTWLQPRVTRRS
jgi:hypothetical protein